MKVVALTDLPNGTQAGRIVEMTADEADILMLPGIDAVRPASEDEVSAVTHTPKRRGGYLRRDLQATS